MHAAPALRATMATGRVWRWPNERRYYARQPPPRAAWATMPHEHALQCDVRHSSGGDRAGARTTVRIGRAARIRSEEHTSELQSLMRNSYAVFCLQKKKKK